jgi:hypothetical protein
MSFVFTVIEIILIVLIGYMIYSRSKFKNRKMPAGLLGIFLGAWGVHQFYLGDSKKGIIRIVVTLVTCGIGEIWGFIEGIYDPHRQNQHRCAGQSAGGVTRKSDGAFL